eukprot:10118339-Alexandrium_andersonii.AAC.1
MTSDSHWSWTQGSNCTGPRPKPSSRRPPVTSARRERDSAPLRQPPTLQIRAPEAPCEVQHFRHLPLDRGSSDLSP